MEHTQHSQGNIIQFQVPIKHAKTSSDY